MIDKTSPRPASPYTKEATTFVTIMRGLAPDIVLDYSTQSIASLEAFIAEKFDPPGSHFVGEQLPIGLGCYVGEVIIRTLGGEWKAGGQPEIHHIDTVQKIFPVAKAQKRLQNGPVDSLTHYYNIVASHTAPSQ